MKFFRGTKTRYLITLEFLARYVNFQNKILDLGFENELSSIMKGTGYQIVNTDFDLDKEPEKLSDYTYDVVTAFEILEHLIEPASVLKKIHGRLLASVPLATWFVSPHWNPVDAYDQHYHEFHPRQFDKLLNHCGWTIIESRKVRIVKRFGLRQMLSLFFPRYYFVYAEKSRETVRG